MTTPTFGPPIPCEGKRPAWLTAGEQKVQWRHSDKDVWWEYPIGLIINWPQSCSIRLPADHWAYEPISRGFEPWAGAEEAPGDWDDGEVLCRDGSTKRNIAAVSPLWNRCPGGYTITGYKRLAKPASPAEESGEEWSCAASKQALPEPADCDWPVCGCDPYADKVIAALEESGAALPARPNTVTLERMSEEEWVAMAYDLYPNSYPAREGILTALRHLDLIAPPETPLDRFCRERGVTAEQRAAIEEWEARK